MRVANSQIEYEKRVVAKMVAIYCRAKHKAQAKGELCSECRELLDYVFVRLDRCPYGEGKGVCSKCEIHCYKPAMRSKITQVMRFSGKRMLFYSPSAALWHLRKVLVSMRKG